MISDKTRGAAFEMDWRKLGCFSSDDTTILHTFLSAPACTDMVYSKELESDNTTISIENAMLHLKTLAFIPSQNLIGLIFLHPKDA